MAGSPHGGSAYCQLPTGAAAITGTHHRVPSYNFDEQRTPILHSTITPAADTTLTGMNTIFVLDV